ncbi:cytochrome P450 [Clavulina sp. PMI_390]|nr:cytochrome P450 [Clavulina sp. PMI_390]
MNDVFAQAPSLAPRQWHSEFGHIVRYDGFLKSPRISITDPRALHHVLISEPYKFPKPPFVRKMLASALGEGLVIVEGEDHRRQRKIMNPSFGPAHIKSLYPVFMEKSHQANVMLSFVQTSSAVPAPLDMYDFANRATLDVISSAGFGYEVNAIERGNENELAAAFNDLFSAVSDVRPAQILRSFFPVLSQIIPDWSPRVTATTRATETMRRIGDELTEEKKRNAINAATLLSRSPEKSETPGVEASQLGGSKDLLSILVKANMAIDLKPSQKLSDTEVAAQISTFLLAGNDTTANAITWGIYGLCKYPSTQKALRQELVDAFNTLGDSPTLEELNALPYLDAVVRETLRRYSPVMATTRVASRDSVLPLAKPFVDTAGTTHGTLFIPKGATIFVPIGHMQTNCAVWGPDALEFRPERWLHENASLLPEGVNEMPSIAFPTFLAGSRACIGFRFTLAEMKLIFYDLIRVMNFELAVPPEEIEGRTSIVTRPRLASRPSEGWQLPVLVTPIEHN